MNSFTARAAANVALVKYFGKRDATLNLPASPSLSLTLAPLTTETTVRFTGGPEDEVFLAGGKAPEQFAGRVGRFLDVVRRLGDSTRGVRVETANFFPTGAGLASSASGFAALAVACDALFGLGLDRAALSALARRGSGSAARSICGGFALWERGEADDGHDSFAHELLPHDDWDVRLLAGITDPSPKSLGSTAAMERTRATSPYYEAWIAQATADVASARAALERRDLERLGEIAEANALAMHAAALAARPGIVYWNGATIEVLHLARRLRASGVGAWFTCDAGAQPKLLTSPPDEERVAHALAASPGVREILRCRPAPPAGLIAAPGQED